jgi:SAM-dependent methyltransferase
MRDVGRVPWCAEKVLKSNGISSVLDIGCGDGGLLSKLDGRVQRVVGIDMDDSLLEQARRVAPGAELVHQSAEQLPFDEGQFDAVVLSDVLEHVGQELQQGVISEARRVLKPGGLLILTVPHTGWTAFLDPMDVKRRLPRPYRWYMRRSGYEPSTATDIGHAHLSRRDLVRLLDGYFVVDAWRFCGFLEPLILWVQLLASRLLKVSWSIVYRIIRLRAREGAVPYPERMAYNVWLIASAV